MILLGVYVGYTEVIDPDIVWQTIEHKLSSKPKLLPLNKQAIHKAFQNQLDGKGFSMVEIVTSCPTNWGLDPLKSLEFIEEKMLPEFPLGVIRDR